MIKRFVRAAALLAITVAGTATLLSGETMAIAVIGDVPYLSDPGFYDRMIADINTSYKKVKFTIHAGDIKNGTSLCENPVYTQNLTLFNTFADAAVYIPGDNEWTDCHRASNGNYDPIERLGYLRSVFFTSPTLSLGRKPITLTRQANYPENVSWTASSVIFVGLNMPGSNNNRNRTTSDGANQYLDLTDSEYTARNTANLAWLNAAFDMAAADPTIKGIMIVAQANPFERFLEVASPTYKVSGYADFISTLRTRTLIFGKPVVYVNGDTHYFRVDRPLTGTYPGCAGGFNTLDHPCAAIAAPTSPTDRVDNFTRVEVFGQNDVHWVRVFIDTDDPKLFTFAPQTVPGN